MAKRAARNNGLTAHIRARIALSKKETERYLQNKTLSFLQVKNTSKQNYYRYFPDINKMCINPIAWSPAWGGKGHGNGEYGYNGTHIYNL